jgi:hypothetical protein
MLQLKLLGHFHFPSSRTPKITKLMGWMTQLLKKVVATNDEYGAVAAIIERGGRRSITGPFPYVLFLDQEITVSLS